MNTEQDTRSDNEVPKFTENGDYNLEYLLDRAYDMFKPDRKKFKFVEPELEKKDRKAYITNFQDVCNSMKRDPDEIRMFIGKELNMDTSIKKDGNLKIDGTSKNLTVELLKKFLGEYINNNIMCQACKSFKTTMQKVDRITFLVCDICKSKKAIAKH
jgi:translation initiation factor 2 subunit 2